MSECTEYVENPKTKGSGVMAVIPHKGICPNKCGDCFYQSGRSFLLKEEGQTLEDVTPNMLPVEEAEGRIIRVNDGHDSGVNPEYVAEMCECYDYKFYNTCLPSAFDTLKDDPVVLTLNPGPMTDNNFHRVWYPNLMMVRFRVNTWNILVADAAVQYYADREVPIILTFMAYYLEEGNMPEEHKEFYEFRKRTLNSYYAITYDAWQDIMARYQKTPQEKWVYSCGKVEGAKPYGDFRCSRCGNCIREYFATKERMRLAANFKAK